MSSWPALSTEWVPGQSGLHRQTLSQNKRCWIGSPGKKQIHTIYKLWLVDQQRDKRIHKSSKSSVLHTRRGPHEMRNTGKHTLASMLSLAPSRHPPQHKPTVIRRKKKGFLCQLSCRIKETKQTLFKYLARHGKPRAQHIFFPINLDMQYFSRSTVAQNVHIRLWTGCAWFCCYNLIPS